MSDLDDALPQLERHPAVCIPGARKKDGLWFAPTTTFAVLVRNQNEVIAEISTTTRDMFGWLECFEGPMSLSAVEEFFPGLYAELRKSASRKLEAGTSMPRVSVEGLDLV